MAWRRRGGDRCLEPRRQALSTRRSRAPSSIETPISKVTPPPLQCEVFCTERVRAAYSSIVIVNSCRTAGVSTCGRRHVRRARGWSQRGVPSPEQTYAEVCSYALDVRSPAAPRALSSSVCARLTQRHAVGPVQPYPQRRRCFGGSATMRQTALRQPLLYSKFVSMEVARTSPLALT